MSVMHMQRDPFARGEYHRESVGRSLQRPLDMCKWCGQDRNILYAYLWESDGSGCYGSIDFWKHHDGRLFCGFDCYASYYDIERT